MKLMICIFKPDTFVVKVENKQIYHAGDLHGGTGLVNLRLTTTSSWNLKRKLVKLKISFWI